MDATTILEIKAALTRFLHQFDDCFARSQTREHLHTYVQGQLGPLPRKSVEPIADAAGTPPRTLQEFLSLSRWDEAMMRDRLHQHVARRHPHADAVGIIDETSIVKKGDKTACVQRQHCGAAGKIDNCVVSVHLDYAIPADTGRENADDPGFHPMLDGELYLPEKTWHQDRARCAEAGIPEHVVYRSKHEIALQQYRRAVGNGARFAWMTFDEFYGRNTTFMRQFDAVGQNYVAEVPVDFHVWTQCPQVLHHRHARELNQPGRPRRFPRLKVKNNPTARVDEVLRHSPLLRAQPGINYHVKDGSKGPMVWQVKHLPVYLKDEHGLPSSGGRPYHLLVARNALDPNEVKYFISNAPESTSVETMLLVAFSRGKIERMFEDSKMELGMDHFEARKFNAISRHLLLSCVSQRFLADFRQQHLTVSEGGKKTPTLNQIATVLSVLVAIWFVGGRCSRRRADTISAQLAVTQQRNAKAAKSHRKRTIRQLHEIGITLKTLRRCRCKKTYRCSTKIQHIIDGVHSRGFKIFTYFDPFAGVALPEAHRRTRGLGLWKSGLDGTMNWSYTHIEAPDPKQFNGYPAQQSMQHSFVWRGQDSVIDTLSWEGFREGVDDARYYATLLHALEQAEATGRHHSLVEQTRQWLEDIDVDTDLHMMRLEMSQIISHLLQ